MRWGLHVSAPSSINHSVASCQLSFSLHSFIHLAFGSNLDHLPSLAFAICEMQHLDSRVTVFFFLWFSRCYRMPTTPEHDEAGGLVHLPAEILLHIISFLEPAETTSLQLTSKKLLGICRDDALWKAKCFDESSFLAHYDRRQQRITPYNEQSATASSSHDEAGSRRKERVRIMDNWDPSFPGENVNWYDEFVHRTAPVAVNWLQQPSLSDGSESTHVEARGLALYRPDGADSHPHKLETIFAVSPLDDGSVCLWDVTGAKGRKGAIYAKSRPGILFIDVSSARLDSGFTECVSVDNKLHLAFFTVQSRKSHSIASTPACAVADYKLYNTDLVEVDLRTLAVVGCESFPWSITALSPSDPCAPLTVGTNNGIHLYDFRSRPTSSADEPVRLDAWDGITTNTKPLPPYAPPANQVPLSILHMQRPGADADMTDEVYVAGRFPSILLYDRRMFPSIKGSLHSGASLSSLASLPFPYSTLDNELRREGQMSLEQIEKSKTTPAGGRTLLACGEYKSKGSLEMYGLLPYPRLPTSLPGGLSNSVFKNRHSSSDSKLFSCVTQGTRLVVSDGSGRIKWFERDGCTEVRRVNIGHCERPHGPSVFTSVQDAGDMAKKLLPTRGDTGDRVNDNDLLFWTGEHLGMVTFTSSPGFNAESFEEKEKTNLELERERVERQYSESMREALERQADGVRFVRNLGLGV